MPRIDSQQVRIPCDVPPPVQRTYVKRFLEATRHTGKLMMFAGDQKIEHLNDDFYGEPDSDGIAEQDQNPEHLFTIAREAEIGVFATQLGLINQYARDFPDIRYLAKLNSKSHLVSTQQHEPISRAMWSVEDVVEVAKASQVNILGVGYTCYLGSEEESYMLTEAAQIIKQAHAQGMLAVIWMYPRGKAIANEKDPHLLAGATGVAVCLGADFVKVNYPTGQIEHPEQRFREAVAAAGRTGVICAGGKPGSPEAFLQQLHDQINLAGAAGNATGRNIHQKDLQNAVRLCNAISAITLGDRDVAFAHRVYRGEAEFSLADD